MITLGFIVPSLIVFVLEGLVAVLPFFVPFLVARHGLNLQWGPISDEKNENACSRQRMVLRQKGDHKNVEYLKGGIPAKQVLLK